MTFSGSQSKEHWKFCTSCFLTSFVSVVALLCIYLFSSLSTGHLVVLPLVGSTSSAWTTTPNVRIISPVRRHQARSSRVVFPNTRPRPAKAIENGDKGKGKDGDGEEFVFGSDLQMFFNHGQSEKETKSNIYQYWETRAKMESCTQNGDLLGAQKLKDQVGDHHLYFLL